MSDSERVEEGFILRWLAAPAVAAMFLTRLPVRASTVQLADAVAGFPLVGLLVGGLGGGAYWLAALVGLPPLASALIALAVTATVTGALHEDGLADAADGLAGRSPEHSVEIMRDSRTGGYGVLAMVFSVALRAAALAALAGPFAVLSAMAAAGAVSRAVIPPVMLKMSAASDSGLGASAGKPRAPDVLAGLGLALLLASGLLGVGGALAVCLSAAVAAVAVAALARRRLGGYTGDVLGAVQQIAEIAALLALAAMN